MTIYIVIIISLLFSFFFSGMEIAYVSSNKIHIEIEKMQKSFVALVLKRITERPSKFITTMLVGNNVCLVVYGLFMGELLVNLLPLHGASALLVHTIISTLIILITAEFTPKVFFQIYANTLIKFFAFPAYFFYVIFSPISEFVVWLSDSILRVFFKTEGDDVQLSFSKIELGNYISEQMETIDDREEVDSEIQIFQNALDFSELRSREVMVPRTEVISVELNTPISELNKLFVETGFSKILVFEESIDNLLGYVHAFELFKKPKSIKEVLRPVVLVPETMLAKDALNLLMKQRKSIAAVIDEYGGMAGIMTVEDIIEELFGEIEDEHDSVALTEEKLGENHYIFSARLEVDYLNEVYKWDLPENDAYETLGGMIVNYTEEIPEKDETVEINNFTFKILEVSSTKIELVELFVGNES